MDKEVQHKKGKEQVGEIADSIIEGAFCQVCGEYMGEGDGYPRTCAGCAEDDDMSDLVKVETSPKVKRVEWATEKLEAKGWDIEPGPDKTAIKICSPTGRWFNFWPYSGWFTEKGSGVQGRGFANLLRVEAGEKQRSKQQEGKA